jgi:outer membrane protein
MHRSRKRQAVLGATLAFLLLTLGRAGAGEANLQALSLEECQTLAREHNPTLSAAREKVLELTADYQAARSRFFPRLALLSYYQQVAPDRLSPGGAAVVQPLFGQEALTSLTGKQIVFDGLQTYYTSRAARLGTQAQEQETRRTADEVAFAVTAAFFQLLEAKEDLKVAREALQERQQFLRLTEAFFQAGKITRLDVFRAQAQVLEAEQAETEAGNAVRLAREILARTLGLDNVLPDIRGRLPQTFRAAPDPDSLWQEAQKGNPEIQRLALEVDQTQTLVKAAKGGYLPEVSLQGAVGVRHRDVGGTKEEWLGGVFMEFPFFEGGLTRAQVAKAASQYRQALERKRERLNGLKADLTAAWKDQEDARRGVATSRQTIAANEEGYNSALTLYRHGQAIGLDVLQAQVELTASRFSLIRFAVAHEIAQARIVQLVGGDPAP